MPQRATKIVATLGPASSDPQLLEQMIRAGVNVVRLNFSHGTAQDHIDRASLVRSAAQRVGVEVAIMADLQGPKIRVGKFAEGKVMLMARYNLFNGGADTAQKRATASQMAEAKDCFPSGAGRFKPGLECKRLVAETKRVHATTCAGQL